MIPIEKKKTSKISAFKNLIYILKMIWEISPSRILMELFNALVDFGSWVFFSVIFWRYILGDDARTFRECAIFICTALVVRLILYTVSDWFTVVSIPISDIEIHKGLNKKLFIKAASVDLSCYETPEFYEKYTLATAEAFERGVSAVQNFSRLVSTFIFSVVGVVMMMEITPWCLPFILLPLAGHLWISPKASRVTYNMHNEMREHKRVYEYVNRTVYLQKYAGEMRMTGIFGVMRRYYEDAFVRIKNSIKKYRVALGWYHWLGCILAYVVSFVGMWIVAAYMALETKSINLSAFIVLATAISSTSHTIGGFGQAIRFITNDSVFIQNIKEFLAYEPKISEDQDGISVSLPVQTIEFKNVSFKYDGTDRYALKNVNVTLKSGEKVTVVGINGSGKSTFIKLLMRLYDPTDGEILLNGINIKEYNLHEYRMLIGATFQDFALFAASVAENVVLDEIKDKAQYDAAVEALKESDVYERIMKLENGADAMLTREFDDSGAVLSGGEGQKVAIARAFAKQSPIVILDEPSSALDPIAEFKMYETILRLCSQCDEQKGKIAIIISHRLSAAALSDKILVLKDATVDQFGTHSELMQSNGFYADMFRKQAESYLASESEVASNV